MVGIVVALQSEAKDFISKIDNISEKTVFNRKIYFGKVSNEDIVLIISGIGKVNASLCTQFLIDNYSPKYIINFGTAGGLVNTIQVTDIYSVTKACQYDFDISELDNVPRGYIQDYETVFFNTDGDKLNFLQKGILASGDRFSNSKTDYDNIINMGATLKDMEGGAIAEVCTANGIPFYLIKGISDIFGSNSASEQFYSNLSTVCSKFPDIIIKIIEYLK